MSRFKSGGTVSAINIIKISSLSPRFKQGGN